MATQYTAKIEFDRIIKIGIWSNEKAKTTLANTYKQLQSKYPGKEVYISNAGFFTMNSSIPAIFGLKADGVVYSADWAKCYMGMSGNKIQFVKGGNPINYTDAVSAYPVLIEEGKKSSLFSHCIDNSDRGRTMLGYTDNAVVLSCIADTSGKSDFTLDEELDYMLGQGCKYAINLDGGGSSQCNFNGKTITSSRKVSNFIYMIVEPEKQESVVITTSFSVGSVVKLKSGAKYTSGKPIPNWVIKSTLYCRSINSNGTITISTQKTGAITGTVSTSYIEGSTTSVSVNTASNSYTVKVTCTALNIRKGPGVSYGANGTLKKNNQVVICEVSGNWGRLSDGRGWISLGYTKKI